MLMTMLALLALGAAPSAETIGGCRTIPIRASVSEQNSFNFRNISKIMDGGTSDVVFKMRKKDNPLAGKMIVREDPTMGVLLLDDGTGLQFERDCSGTRCIYSGISRARSAAKCWPWLTDDYYQASREGVIEIDAVTQLSFRRKGSPGELFLRRAIGKVWKEERLVLGSERIVGVGLSPPLHGRWFSMDVIRQHRDGSVIVTTYMIAPYQ